MVSFLLPFRSQPVSNFNVIGKPLFPTVLKYPQLVRVPRDSESVAAGWGPAIAISTKLTGDAGSTLGSQGADLNSSALLCWGRGTSLAIWDVLVCTINSSGDFSQHGSPAAIATGVVTAAGRHG